MSKLLPLLIKKVAEGDFGQGLAKFYWALAGKKLYISIAIGLIALGLDYIGGAVTCGTCLDYKGVLFDVAGVLAVLGLYDGAIRSTPPEDPDA